MKSISLVCVIALISVSFFACGPKSFDPLPATGKIDTSKTLTPITTLVGNWNIVTDTISYQGNSVMYHGTPADHYIFTKYGNLFVKEGLNNLIDTAQYVISAAKNQVAWVYTYISVNGVSSTQLSDSPPFNITSVDSVSLVLTSNLSTAQGLRYEQITFKK
jgi:hypothetical protein